MPSEELVQKLRGEDVMDDMLPASTIVVNAIIVSANTSSSQRLGQGGVCSTSSSTALLPKNASTSNAIATSVQRTARVPRHP